MTIQDISEDATDHLLAQISNGDRDALEALFRAEAGRMVAIARRIVRRSDLAEEVVQEAFVLIWQRASQFDSGRGRARAWMTRIVRNRALNLIRDGSRMDFHDGATLEAIGDREQDASHAYAALPERHALKVCLDQLETGKRRSILLCYVTGMSHGEVAEKLGAPLGTIKAWIRRGMASLRECLG
ncbi:sigma-70 family RNA polymerase sigma factor [Pelagibacterium montanilacus]|uniref:sigma-70 family RNA polymerase sigma factor n=1 Tax=Pelagibacterium montanilacus TaxID=2185280 RepID=UPI001FEC5E16|nr:sigma-70 family RNA polymerase sigma factor [Pelagibacterium montanilacus]